MKRNRGLGLCSVLMISACLSAQTPAAGPTTPAPINAKAEIRRLRQERTKALATVLEALQTQYSSGGSDMEDLSRARTQWLAAALESADKPEARIKLLEGQRTFLEARNQEATTAYKSGVRSNEDLLRLKADLLEIQIRILQERSRSGAKRP